MYAGFLCLLLIANLLVFPDKPFPVGATVRLGLGSEGRFSVLLITAPDGAAQGGDAKGGSKARPMKSIKGKPLKQQLGDMQCIALALWFSFGLLTLQFYLANVEYELAGMTADALQANSYKELFSFLVPFGFVALPISGYVLDNKGLSTNFFLATVCLIAFHILTLTKVMELQVAAFGLWVLGRFFLFSSFFAYLPSVFGFATFGQVNGAISLASSVIGLLQCLLRYICHKCIPKQWQFEGL